MSRFYIDPNDIDKETIYLNAEDSRHALSVLRLKSGAVVDLIDGKGGAFRGVVASVKHGLVQVSLNKNTTPGVERLFQITLGAAIIRSERMDLLVQKACELGVAAVWPLVTERTIIKVDKERRQSKVRRWQKIAHESCKQCGLSRTPVIEEPKVYKDILVSIGLTRPEGVSSPPCELIPRSRGPVTTRDPIQEFDLILIPTLGEKTIPLSDALRGKDPKKILILIGPEGDFTPKEAGLALSKGAVPVSLGPLVLRSETAALYALAAVSFFYGEISPRP